MNNLLGITLGDVWGIGPEILAKSLVAFKKNSVSSIKIYADEVGFKKLAQEQNFLETYQKLQEHGNQIVWQPLSMSCYSQQSDTKSRAQIAQASLDKAIEEASDKKIEAIITSPLDKKVMKEVYKDFVGHTEYLRDAVKVNHTWMMLDNGDVKIVLLTNHLLLRDVPKAVSKEKLQRAVKDIHAHFTQLLEEDSVNIAVCGLNPHCGELSDSSEEVKIIEPAVKELQNEGYAVEGPFSADALFYQARASKRWTAILAMYHDQGLVAAKYPGTEQAINVTLGLPFVRVSPGHGVAYDLVGQNKANYRSMLKALQYTAIQK